jgi:sigma-B regulation protein RsbU (phosphoserine phosphatase)
LASWRAITEKLRSLGLLPRTRMARFAAYVAGIELVLLALKWIFRLTGAARIASPLDRWTTVLGYVLFFLLVFLALRWFRNHVMWSVRNRLLVTYLFIGGVPVTLAVLMALGTGYLTVEHLATFLAVSSIREQEQRLSAANAAAAEQIVNRRKLPHEIMASDTLFPGRSLTIVPVSDAPKWLNDGFTGLASDQGQLYLRAANLIQTPHGRDMVISSVPFDQKFLARVAANLGALGLSESLQQGAAATPSSPAPAANLPPSGLISAGTVSPPQATVDPELRFGGLIQTVDWSSGGARSWYLAGITRPSAIYNYVGLYMGVWTGVIGVVLFGTAIAFAVVVLIALIIGIRLTRTITYSVANLYKATEHINRGDFTHRIQVRENDQLAALQRSFNSMTDSLQKLIAEQKEKERLQSELEIAHEVQAQLFPRELCGTSTLEMHGVCRPARIVSGDYYDFLAYGPEQVGIAVGDISGKGISAALLMATIHSAVRAYEQELMAPVSASSAAAYATDMRIATIAPRVARPSPAQMLWLLNRHLYQTTQPEKYATLFLSFYDDDSGCLTYSNAGHLPPVILSEDGSTRRLDVGGTVVGLFDDRGYEEQTVELYPGDIFIAFSDGMTEPENEFGEYGEERLIETIATHRHLPLERICEMAVAAVQDWIGSTEQPDDVTLVLARRTK